MNPNSKDPMVREFAKWDERDKKTEEQLDRSLTAAKAMYDILKKWKPEA